MLKSCLIAILLLILVIQGCCPKCENGGICESGKCSCPQYFSGDNCEIDNRPACAKNHSGTLVLHNTSNITIGLHFSTSQTLYISPNATETLTQDEWVSPGSHSFSYTNYLGFTTTVNYTIVECQTNTLDLQ